MSFPKSVGAARPPPVPASSSADTAYVKKKSEPTTAPAR
jgi:hypothetical protein